MMRSSRSVLQVVICAVILMLPVVLPAATVRPLASPPLGDRWFSISMNGDKVGFAHTNITPIAKGFRITSEGSANMLVLGFSREVAAKERYDVNPDLTLRSFEVEQTIDKSPMNLTGTVTGNNVKITVTTKGGSVTKTLAAKGKVYPPPAINLYPLLKGFAPGRKYTLQMLDVESAKLKDLTVTGIGIEQRNNVELLHIRNDLYTFVDNDIWLDRAGNTIEESVRDGLIVTRAEDPAAAAGSLLEDAVAKKDLVLDFSLVRIDREIADQDKLSRLVIELSGYPVNQPVPAGPGQKGSRLAPDRIRLELEAPLRQTGGHPLSPSEKSLYLAATPRINADHPEIIARQKALLAASPSTDQAVATLVRWVAETLADTVLDSHSAAEALELRKGNCQSHTRLYVALARAAGIPTRMVSGLVYARGQGFLYHSWAESYADGWIAVDPTFGQAPADLTHLRLVEGDEPAEMMPLTGIVGKIRARMIELAYSNSEPGV